MNEMLQKIGCPILDVPDLSGRFAGSISNVGIVPAYLSQVNIQDFLTGLEVAYDNFMNLSNNPALAFASYLYNLYNKGYKVVF